MASPWTILVIIVAIMASMKASSTNDEKMKGEPQTEASRQSIKEKASNITGTASAKAGIDKIGAAMQEKVYIVYMGSLPRNSGNSSLHMEMLQDIKGRKAADSLVYSYYKSFNGFAAKLTVAEMESLSAKEGVVSVFESKVHLTQTTRSWDFIGFNSRTQRNQAESDIIVGVIDSGIWPESYSFKDVNFGPPPAKWRGICQGGLNFTCNKKVIGAQYYNHKATITTRYFISSRDSQGHGTHTASTVAGGLIEDAGLFGIGAGTARGGVPSARLAIYKACWSFGCTDADLLSAFHDAIEDGVDVISVSVGSSDPRNYFEDAVAIGSFHAYKRGILTSAAGGNYGPKLRTLINGAPWTLSVAATTIDRSFLTVVKLGDGESLKGLSANTFDDEGSMRELVELSCPASLEGSTVQDKVVLCRYDSFKDSGFIDESGISQILHKKGAAGALFPILERKEAQKDIEAFPLPAATISTEDAYQTSVYINSTRHPTASISKTSHEKDPSAPIVPDFSSRGPNRANLDMLKPDIAAPGVNILAAWSAAVPLTFTEGDDRRTGFNIESGTSMACPHASASAAFIKSFYPTWSPSMIISALLTTARPMSPQANFGAELAYGAGFINPLSALQPGLVYEIDAGDFVEVLCSSGYTTDMLQLITGDNTTCSSTKSVWDLNYPTFAAHTLDGGVSANFSRLLTCVRGPSSYQATVEAAVGFSIWVEPHTLYFNSSGDKQSFQMFIRGTLTGSSISSSALIWSDGTHVVRSPIVIYSVQNS